MSGPRERARRRGAIDFTRGIERRATSETLEPAVLLPSERMREKALAGDVTQIHRGRAYAAAGDRFELEGEPFEVVDVTERRLGDLTDEDARAEGVADLDAYRRLLERAHDDFEWDDESTVVRHRFERR